MKGSGGKVEFEKKYCGRQTASLKFTGDQTIKIIFKVRYFMSCSYVHVHISCSCSCLNLVFTRVVRMGGLES